MIKVGITGGIGSGKTTACKVFELLGVPVFYSDEESKNILYNNLEVSKKISNAFGEAVIGEGKKIDKRTLGMLVFSNKEKLEQLNAILHPAVAIRFEEWIKEHKEHPYILKEAAILLESGANKQVDSIITVTAPYDLKIIRAMKRDNLSSEQVEQRMKNQMSDEDKIKLSQFVIYNDEKELLIPQVLKIHSFLIDSK